MQCTFCNKEFSSKSNLNAHQKSAKYCLDLQGKKEKLFECEYCTKNFTQKQALIVHCNTCKEKDKKSLEHKFDNENSRLKTQIEELKNYISKLESKLEKFENAVISMKKGSTHTTTTNNVTINNGLDLSKERVRNVIERQLTPLIAGRGQEGLAELCATHLLKNENGDLMYKCTDPSRQIFEYRDNDGCLIKDVKAKKLTNALSQSGNLDKKARESGEKLWKDEKGEFDNEKFNFHVNKVTDISNLPNDNSKFRVALTTLTS
jgi:hypothetical protein